MLIILSIIVIVIYSAGFYFIKLCSIDVTGMGITYINEPYISRMMCIPFSAKKIEISNQSITKVIIKENFYKSKIILHTD
jgi:hypothetical protein